VIYCTRNQQLMLPTEEQLQLSLGQQQSPHHPSSWEDQCEPWDLQEQDNLINIILHKFNFIQTSLSYVQKTTDTSQNIYVWGDKNLWMKTTIFRTWPMGDPKKIQIPNNIKLCLWFYTGVKHSLWQ
jgi:hypothetical protein